MVEITEIAAPPGAMPVVEPTSPEVVKARVDVSPDVPDTPPTAEEAKPKKTRRSIGKKPKAEPAPEPVQQVEATVVEESLQAVGDIAAAFDGAIVEDEASAEELTPEAAKGEHRYRELTELKINAVGIAALLSHTGIPMEGGIACLARIPDEPYDKMLAYFNADSPAEGGLSKADKIKAVNQGIIGSNTHSVSADNMDQYLDALGKLFV